jgi:GTP-binding protein
VSEGRNEVNRPAAKGSPRPSERGPAPLVAIIGRVNVGKSTLFNRLARQRRALVEDRPGVTRDRVVAQAEIEGREILLVDTGGLDPAAERGIPAAVKAQARQAIEDAAVILFVVDARDGLLPLDHEIAHLLREAERSVLLVVNKVDGPPQEIEAAEFHALGLGEGVLVSAEHRRGVVDLELAIATRLPAPVEAPAEPHDPAVGVAIVGRPNVGKSSLVNQLAGEERTIVSEEPGTTRDSTDVRLEVEGGAVVLTDTAGLRRAGRRADRLERGTAWMALRAIERAEVAVLLVDAVEGVTEQDARIARIALDRGRPLVVALNKWDAVDSAERGPEIEKELDRRLHFIPERVVFRVSARTGSGVSRLLPSALEVLRQASPEVATSQINRALEEAFERNQPPMRGRRRLRLFYGTQISQRPFTVLVFVNDPRLMPENYRRYLEGFLRRRFDIRAAPVRVRLRARAEKERG